METVFGLALGYAAHSILAAKPRPLGASYPPPAHPPAQPPLQPLLQPTQPPQAAAPPPLKTFQPMSFSGNYGPVFTSEPSDAEKNMTAFEKTLWDSQQMVAQQNAAQQERMKETLKRSEHERMRAIYESTPVANVDPVTCVPSGRRNKGWLDDLNLPRPEQRGGAEIPLPPPEDKYYVKRDQGMRASIQNTIDVKKTSRFKRDERPEPQVWGKAGLQRYGVYARPNYKFERTDDLEAPLIESKKSAVGGQSIRNLGDQGEHRHFVGANMQGTQRTSSKKEGATRARVVPRKVKAGANMPLGASSSNVSQAFNFERAEAQFRNDSGQKMDVRASEKAERVVPRFENADFRFENDAREYPDARPTATDRAQTQAFKDGVTSWHDDDTHVDYAQKQTDTNQKQLPLYEDTEYAWHPEQDLIVREAAQLGVSVKQVADKMQGASEWRPEERRVEYKRQTGTVYKTDSVEVIETVGVEVDRTRESGPPVGAYAANAANVDVVVAPPAPKRELVNGRVAAQGLGARSSRLGEDAFREVVNAGRELDARDVSAQSSRAARPHMSAPPSASAEVGYSRQSRPMGADRTQLSFTQGLTVRDALLSKMGRQIFIEA